MAVSRSFPPLDRAVVASIACDVVARTGNPLSRQSTTDLADRAQLRTVEERLLGMKELSTIYARAGEGQRGSNEVTEDTVGTIQFEFVDWRERRPASAIMDEIRDKTKDIPGVVIEVTKPKAGPATGKPVTVQIASFDPDNLFPAARKAAELAAK